MTDSMTDALVSRVRLELDRLVAQEEVPAHILQNGELVAMEAMDDLGRHLVVRLRTWLARSREGSTVITFRQPRTWWQHLKHDYAGRWWMRWYVRRRPVDYVTTSQRVTARALLPDLPVEAEDILRRYKEIVEMNVETFHG